ncbi:protein stoned-B-like [Planococcus citri]|uniref:protein stoned-B-like n=1 Tax=Planococcus citri TaxID=170843 RepID=UPI0031F86069
MLKIHKGLKKKKKDKKNKHKEDELFNEEELEKYRKEHSKPVASTAEPDLAQPSNSSGGGSGDQSDEWQKFKALTAGVDTILQKTQEDLDRIKSTSFFQRKPPPSEVERQKEEERQEAEEQQQQQQQAKDHEDGEQQSGADGAVEFAAKSESEDESEEVEVDDTLFDTSYVDAVASGELKLAYIPDSPTEKEDDFDPFDTSYANKFIESNPKKRYLNLGCAVQVLSGRQSVVSAESSSPAVFGDKKSRRRRPKPVDLLLTSFDDGADPQSAVPTVVERTPVDSPVKTLLDEDPLLLAKDVDLAPLAVTPIPAVALASTPVNPPSVPDKKEPKLDLSDFELDEFDVLATTATSGSASASAGILDLCKQPSNESTDDEFAQLAAESLARKSSSALPTPNEPIKSFDATTPSSEFHAVDPLQPIAPPEQEEIDPFDTSIVAKVILPGKQEIKLLERELLSDITASKAAPPSRVDDIDDDDFDPRAGESSPVKAIRPQELLIKHKAQVDQIVSPSKKPDFLKIEDVDVEVAKPLTPLAAAVKPDEQLDSEYDPFDTSHVCGAPGKLELKLIENELSQKDDQDQDDDFDPRKYDGADRTQSTATSLTHSILTKYACNPQPPQPEQVEPVAIDILTGKEEDADAIRNFSTPVEPQKFVIESPSEIAFSDPFDTSIAENIQPGKVELKLLETELIFMTESQSTNPFLMGGAFDTSATVSNAAAAEYNPFGANAASSFSSNPFLQSFGASVADSQPSAEPAAGTNPFAAFFTTEATSTNVFAPPPQQPSTDIGATFNAFSTSATPAWTTPAAPAAPKRPSIPSSVNQVSDLLGDFTETAPPPPPPSVPSSTPHSMNTSPVDKGEKPVPRRPPPPRPMPPRESKELILSVTAALEQTSTDLLDRLQATRTPSPTPLRDLNSPSPTLMGEVNDLLGDDIEMPKMAAHGEIKHTKHDIQQEAISLFDAIANLSKDEEHKDHTITAARGLPPSVPAPSPVSSAPTPPPAAAPAPFAQPSQPPLPPSRPPPPPLPVHCETDLSNLTSSSSDNASKFEQAKIITRADSRETPQTSRKSSLKSTTSSRKSSLDFSNISVVEAPPVRPPAPPEIIEEIVDKSSSSSSSMPPPPAPPVDRKDSGGGGGGIGVNYVATRKASHDVTASRTQIIPTHKKYSLDYSSGFFAAEQNVIKEKFEQYSTAAEQAAAAATTTDPSYDNKILEAAKFPVISTTPIMSCENINNETLYENENENDVEIEKEPSLIFDEAVEKVDPFASFIQNENRPTPDPFVSYSDLGGSSANANAYAYTTAAQVSPAADPFAAAFSRPVFDESQGKDDFDMFQEKFENVKQPAAADPFDPFSASGVAVNDNVAADEFNTTQGFGNEDTFDEFLAMNQPPPTFDANFNQSIQQTDQYGYSSEASWPPDTNNQEYGSDAYAATNTYAQPPTGLGDAFNAAMSQKVAKTDSTETPPTPLFDEDVSQPLLPFPRTNYTGPGWEMQIRYPIRKKFTGQRFWKKVFVRLVYQGETPHLELVNKDDGKETLNHEWPLQPCYAISDIGAQQYDQYGKIFTVKIQFVVYKERPGVRPGQVTKAERLTNKLSQFAAYAIQGDYQGVKEFGSDLKKLGLPVEHSPQISLICKLGSHNYEDMKQFSACVEDALFRLSAHRDNIHINYKMEEVQITAVDELYVEQNAHGSIDTQIARVRLFFLGFLTGMPDVEIGVNDLWRQGKEVVGRHDIIPVVTEEWIRLENVEFHTCIQQNVYEETRTIKLKPPDACYLELMRFRVRPPKNRELPLQLKTVFRICGNKVDILADILVPGFTSRKLGQIPCEDVAVRIPIPECWIYLFRVEKHFRYGSVKSAHRRTGKIKGIERFLGAVDTLEQHLIEVTSGHAKYEHHHKSIVWRMSRLPKEGQGAYTTHNLICHLQLTSYDQVPDELAKYCYVEFTMPVTQVSHTTVRSVSISNSDSDTPPEKYVRHLARHEYRVEIEHAHAESTSDYIAATITKPSSVPAAAPPAAPARPPSTDPDPPSDSDSE